MDKLIGRKREIEDLSAYMETPRSEFIAVYGRRRVGKTFLIRHLVDDEFAFFVTGVHGATKTEQLTNFAIALQRHRNGGTFTVAANWLLAFYELSLYLESLPEGRKCIFIDELPWFDSAKSGFIPALENFWNSWASLRDDIKLIVCGSATSWMLNNLIHSRGGLHNRLTFSLRLEPFTLSTCEFYLKEHGFNYSRREIANCYMVFGGVPFYLSKLLPSLSLAQNIDRLFFARNAPMLQEFNDLYSALFNQSGLHVKVVAALSQKSIGMTRQELIKELKYQGNGEFSTVLSELEACGFIRKYAPFMSRNPHIGERTTKDALYQLVDFYTLFYYNFVPASTGADSDFWMHTINTPQRNTWNGLAFEMLCLSHINQIKARLGIAGVLTNVSAWRSQAAPKGAQIDLVIDRKDETVNLCEMKYSEGPYAIEKDEAEKLTQRCQLFIDETKTSKSIMLTLVSPQGLRPTSYSSLVQSVITLDDLFAE